MSRLLTLIAVCVVLHASTSSADDTSQPDTPRGDLLLEEYFEQQVSLIEAATFDGIETLADWEAKRGEYRRQLADMLGLDPMPEKTSLQAVVTGTLDHDEFTVEKLHFQSSPGLYVTGNLYVPKGLDKPAPTVLYVCGHAQVKEEGVAYGSKVAYQHHPIWFARHGYVCLIIDTLQLGEIEGLHHGTYREGMWRWQSRGYTPAGVEAWNCIRALDYLETRPEVDSSRFGVTGRSGGGAYSWWIAALDERIKVAVPVAGIASLRNHLLGPFQTSPWSHGETHGHDGCIEGHCDCMYFINTQRWDFPMVPALVAPRALLISNTDKDRIFPLDGVYDVYRKTQQIYALYGATDKLGLQIVEGPHKDTQRLRVHAFQWINRHLKEDEPPIDVPAEKLFEPQQLKVFSELPADQINTEIHESFVAEAVAPPVVQSPREWTVLRDAAMKTFRKRVVSGWPTENTTPLLDVQQTFSTVNGGQKLSQLEFNSDAVFRLPLLIFTHEDHSIADAEVVRVSIVDESQWADVAATLSEKFPKFGVAGFNSGDGNGDEAHVDDLQRSLDSLKPQQALVLLLPRGIGPTAWTTNEKERIQIKRRFALLGQTLDGLRTWDVRRGIQALQSLIDVDTVVIRGRASGPAAGWLLAASVLDSGLEQITLEEFAADDNATVLINLRRTMSWPVIAALAADRLNVDIHCNDPAEWAYPQRVAEQLEWPEKRFVVSGVESK